MLKEPDTLLDTKILAEPLRIVFYYKSGNNKAGSVETLTQSEWDIIAIDEGRNLPDDRKEPFFTKHEVLAGKRALAEHNLRLA